MNRTINDMVKESNEQGEQSQCKPEQENGNWKQVWCQETETVSGRNVRGVKRHTRWVKVWCWIPAQTTKSD